MSHGVTVSPLTEHNNGGHSTTTTSVVHRLGSGVVRVSTFLTSLVSSLTNVIYILFLVFTVVTLIQFVRKQCPEMAPPPGKHKCEHCGQFFNCRNQHKSGFERTSNKVILERKPVDFGGGLFEVSQPRKIQSCCSTLLVGATSTKTTHFCGFQCYMQKHKEQNPPVFANNNANSKEFRSVKSKK